MNEEKNLRLTVASSPHVASPIDTQNLMRDVLIALVPAMVMGVVFFGPRALVATIISVVACEFFEWAYRKLMKKSCANKEDAIAHLNALVGGKGDITVESLRTRYPQGAEKQLIQRITGREVPPGGLPAHVGCAVFNVGTAAAVYDAVVEGKPLTHRIVTVTGDAIKEPKNLRVPLGTSFQQIIDEGKGFKETPDRVLTGGPMMGIAQYTLDVTCIKGTNAVLCLTKKEAAPVVEEETCLRCARCVNVCPMHLTPVYMHLYAEKGMWKDAEALNVMDCIECGSCNYICPARIHLVQSFRVTKGELRALAAKEKAAKEAAKA